MSIVARTLFVATLAGLALGLLSTLEPARAASDPSGGQTVYLSRDLPDEALVTLGATAAARDGVLVQQRSAPVDTFPLSRFPKVP